MKLTSYVQMLQLWTDKFKFLKPFLRPFAHFYYRYIDNSNRRNAEKSKVAFQSYGLEVLREFDKTMRINGYKYSLAFGTMLGAVREHGFIKHDLDIDTFVWIDDFDPDLLNCLKKSGFKLKHTFLVDNGKLGREDTIELNGVQIDIFYLYPPLEGRLYPYCCDFFPYGNTRSWEQSIKMFGGLLPRRLELPVVDEIVMVPFETISLPILKNADQFLSFRYGNDYLTPKPGWHNGDNPYIIPWYEQMAKFIDYR